MNNPSNDTRAWQYCQLNCWTFPDEFKPMEPKGWDDMTPCEKSANPVFRALIAVLESLTTEEERSFCWNTRYPGAWMMTPEEWRLWWDNGRSWKGLPDEQLPSYEVEHRGRRGLITPVGPGVFEVEFIPEKEEAA